MKVRKCLLLVLLMAVILVLTACTQPTDGGNGEGEGDVAEIVEVTFVTGGAGGPMHTIGGAICNVWNENLDNVNATNSSTAASVVNCNMVSEGKAEVGFTMSDVAYLGHRGEIMFEEPIEGMVGLTSLHTNYVQLITKKNSGINSVYDLKGKRVGVGAPGSGTEFNANCIIEAAGMSYDDLAKADYLSYAETTEQLGNDNIDAGFLTGGLPIAAISEIATTHDIDIIPIDSEIIEELNKMYPIYFEDDIYGDLYKDIPDPVQTAALKNYIVINKDVDEDLVYDLLKTMHENWEQIQLSHSGMKEVTPEMAVDRLEIPLHPGAEKYLKEQGII